jgi:hypothetical protein
MIPILEAILCAIESLAVAIVGLLVVVINALFVAIGAFLSVIVVLLPVMPEPPASPESGVLQFINFFVPLAPMSALLVTMGALFLGAMLVRVALNWLKAL